MMGMTLMIGMMERGRRVLSTILALYTHDEWINIDIKYAYNICVYEEIRNREGKLRAI